MFPGGRASRRMIESTRFRGEGRMAEIKGATLIQTIDAIRARDGEHVLATIVAQLDPDSRSVIQGRIFPWNWYSLDAFSAFLEADIRVTANGNREVLILRSEKVIEAQLRGIYKVFIKLGSPAYVIKRIASVHEPTSKAFISFQSSMTRNKL